MGYRFRKSKTILPGVKISTTGKSASVSFGGKYGRITLNSKGKVTKTARLPGTGISHVSTASLAGVGTSSRTAAAQPARQGAGPAGPVRMGSSFNNRTTDEWREALKKSQIAAMGEYKQKRNAVLFLCVGAIMLLIYYIGPAKLSVLSWVAAISCFVAFCNEKRRHKKMGKAISAYNSGEPLLPLYQFPWIEIKPVLTNAEKESGIKLAVSPEEAAQLKEMWLYLQRHNPNIALLIGLLLLYGILPTALLINGPDRTITPEVALILSVLSLGAFVIIALSFKFRWNCRITRKAIVDFYEGGKLLDFQSMPWLNIKRIDVHQPVKAAESEPAAQAQKPLTDAPATSQDEPAQPSSPVPNTAPKPAGYDDFIDSYKAYAKEGEVVQRAYAARAVLGFMDKLDESAADRRIWSESEKQYSSWRHPVFGFLSGEKGSMQRIRAAVEERYNRDMYIIGKAENFALELESIPHADIQLTDRQLVPGDPDDMELRYTGVGPAFDRDRLASFVVIDTETTGLSAEENDIIELSAIRYKNFAPIEAFTILLDPGYPISADITAINGITSDMVAGAPILAQVADAFVAFVGDAPVVGYNVSFDLKFLYAAGIDLVSQKRKIFDVLKLCRKTYKQLDRFRLADVTEELEIYRYETHRSLSDCLATGKVFDRVIDDIKNA